MIDQARERRPQVQTVDELINESERLATRIQQFHDNPIAERALREQLSEVQRELLQRQRQRNKRDFKQGRAITTMSNTPLPPHAIHAVEATCDLESMR
jgi:hypothetical protein